MADCLICKRINLIKRRKNPDAVAELETGYAVIGWHQFYRGYTLFLSKEHVAATFRLPESTRFTFLKEMDLIAQSVNLAFRPKRVNIEILGNLVPHLHVHMFPRHPDDPDPHRPVWFTPPEVRESPRTIPSRRELLRLRHQLAEAIRQTFRRAGSIEHVRLFA